MALRAPTAGASSRVERSVQHAKPATPLGIRVGTFVCDRPLAWVVNDGMMVVFVFVVGLELRARV